MNETKALHEPVLLNESIDELNVKPNGVYVDCTLGRGGHASLILNKLTTGTLIGLDQDMSAIDYVSVQVGKQKALQLVKGNFADLKMLLAQRNVFAVDGILYDLGVSSPQFDDGERGFSYRFDGPLDMRMDQSQSLTAATVVNEYDEQTLSQLIWDYGDEPFAKQIAKAIVAHRPINTTLELVDVIKSVLPQKILKQKKHPAKKTFQALRVYVNNEMDALEKSLIQSLELLKSRGRIVVITFQSHEENIVRRVFKEATMSKKDQVLKNLPIKVDDPDVKFILVTKKPIKPKPSEVATNFRAHSSKLWVLEKK